MSWTPPTPPPDDPNGDQAAPPPPHGPPAAPPTPGPAPSHAPPSLGPGMPVTEPSRSGWTGGKVAALAIGMLVLGGIGGGVLGLVIGAATSSANDGAAIVEDDLSQPDDAAEPDDATDDATDGATDGAASSQVVGDELIVDDLAFRRIDVYADSVGDFAIRARLTNEGDHTYEYLDIEATILSPDGRILAVLTTFETSVAPGDTRSLTFISFDEYTDDWSELEIRTESP